MSGGRSSRLPASVGRPTWSCAPIAATSICTSASAADQTSICRSGVMAFPLCGAELISFAAAYPRELHRRVAGERVGPLILGMAGMALHPVPFDLVRRCRVDQLLPQLGILDRLPVGGLPAVPAPAVDPFGDAVADVDAVGIEVDPAGPLQRLERRGSRRAAPSGCWWSAARRRKSPSRARPSGSRRPSRPGRDCPCRRRR